MDQKTALVRVRTLAGLSAALESLKLLPALDVVVLAVEWLGLKTAVPIAWELYGAWRERRLTLKSALAAPVTGSWLSLVANAFGPAAGTAALSLDVGTDVGTVVLPPPFDGLDFPPMLTDAALAFFAHRALRSLETATAPTADPEAGPCVSSQRRAPSVP